MVQPGTYRVQSVAEIPIVRRHKYQAQNREKTRDFCNGRESPGSAQTDHKLPNSGGSFVPSFRMFKVHDCTLKAEIRCSGTKRQLCIELEDLLFADEIFSGPPPIGISNELFGKKSHQ